jgi:hypothetical protein
MKTILKAVEDVEEFVPTFKLSNADKKFFSECLDRAREWLNAHGEYRYEIGNIAIAMHERVYGNARWNNIEARQLRSLFARDLGLNIRTVENWMEVKKYVIDVLPETKTENLSYLKALDVLTLMKNKDLTASTAFARLMKKDPNAHRLELMLRYSSNLLNSCQKFKVSRDFSDDIALVKERLHACLEELR